MERVRETSPPSSEPGTLSSWDRLDLRVWVLAFLMSLMAAGVFPTLVLVISHSLVYFVWSVLWIILISFGLEKGSSRLLSPIAPLILFMLLYVAWGSIVADYAVQTEAFRLLFRFHSLALSMTILTSSRGRLRIFASMAQWVLVVNLLFTFFLMAHPEYLAQPDIAKLSVEVTGDRFAGPWRNANQAGLASLLILVLSRWAHPFHARMGRIAGVTIILLSASRTANWILVSLCLIYLLFGATQRIRHLALLVLPLVAILGIFALQFAPQGAVDTIRRQPAVARVLDVTESRTSAAGEGTRMDLLQDWLRKVPGEPWHGYGLFTFSGGDFMPDGIRPGFPDQGPHNLYLGIFLDVGFVGLVGWIGLVLWKLGHAWRQPLTPTTRKALFALFYILLVFSMFNHNMLAEYSGWMFYSLMFLLPTCPAIREEWLVESWR